LAALNNKELGLNNAKVKNAVKNAIQNTEILEILELDYTMIEY